MFCRQICLSHQPTCRLRYGQLPWCCHFCRALLQLCLHHESRLLWMPSWTCCIHLLLFLLPHPNRLSTNSGSQGMKLPQNWFPMPKSSDVQTSMVPPSNLLFKSHFVFSSSCFFRYFFKLWLLATIQIIPYFT